MSNDNPITLGTEVIDAGRRATVTRITELPSNGVEMATLIYLDNDEHGAAPVDELVRADEYAKLLPAPTFTTERIDRHGMNLTGDPVRRYKADTARRAATIAAASYLGRDELMAADIEQSDGGVFAFIPTTGAPVRIRVELVREQPTTTTCPRCAGTNGNHGMVHVRHGNGGGHNEPCPNTPDDVEAQIKADAAAKGGAIAELFGVTPVEHPMTCPCGARPSLHIGHSDTCDRVERPSDAYRSPCCGDTTNRSDGGQPRCDNCGQLVPARTLTWDEPPAVVGRDEVLHPSTHPFRLNETVNYVGPAMPGSDAWAGSPAAFQRMAAPGEAEIMTSAGPVTVEVADLRRPAGNLAIELTPADIARVFQALATELDRVTGLHLDPATIAHTTELRDRFAALHP